MDEQINDTQFPEYYFNVQGDPVRSVRVELTMGSSIIPKCGSNYFIPGVVGPFVKIKGSENLFFVTANHVITQRLVHSGTIAGSQAYMLLYGASKACRCGRVFAGGSTWSRAALVKVSDNLVPSRESFLKHVGSRYAGISPNNFPTFDNRDSRNMTRVIIFGRKKRKTAFVKIVEDRAKGRIYLYACKTGLFKHGEGGSAVFMVDKYRLLHCIGICAGGFHDDPYQFVITPIEIILKQLGQQVGKPLEIATFDQGH